MTTQKSLQLDKGHLLKQLHIYGDLLVVPNIWDPLGAIMLERLGYPVIATASASIAFSNGYPDGEKIPFIDLLQILQRIVQSVKVPVTADIESGYAENNIILKENIKQLIDTGIVGINFEDTHHASGKLISIEMQCEKIKIIRQAAAEMEMPLFINARTDVMLKANRLTDEEKLAEVLLRGKAYRDAGADCFYPIFLKKKEDIKTVIKAIHLPVNILLLPGIPDFETLKNIGLSRISLGPGFLKTTINAMKNIAVKLLHYEGMQEVADNPVTTAYLNNLITNQNADEPDIN